jgi:putative membrane protein
VLVGALALVILYAQGWLRLRRRGRPDLADGARAAAFGAGIAVIVLAVVSPLDEVGEEYLLSAHMIQHLLLGDVGPLLLALGLVGPLSLFLLTRPALRGLARVGPLRAAVRALGRPITAVVIWAAVTAGWHVPVAYEYALTHRWTHDLEHATMTLAGLLVWFQIVAVLPRLRRSPARRAGLALVVFAIGFVVSQVLFLTDPLYDVYVDQPERLFGLSPAADQVRAALFMGTEQLITLVGAAGLLLWTHLERASADAALPDGPPRETERAPVS